MLRAPASGSIAITGQFSRPQPDLRHSSRARTGEVRLSFGASLLFFASSRRLVVVSQKRSLALPSCRLPVGLDRSTAGHADGFDHKLPFGVTESLTGVSDRGGLVPTLDSFLQALSLKAKRGRRDRRFE